jgi:hypothetical protein
MELKVPSHPILNVKKKAEEAAKFKLAVLQELLPPKKHPKIGITTHKAFSSTLSKEFSQGQQIRPAQVKSSKSIGSHGKSIVTTNKQ